MHDSVFGGKERVYENVLLEQSASEGCRRNSTASGNFAAESQGQEGGDLVFTASLIFTIVKH